MIQLVPPGIDRMSIMKADKKKFISNIETSLLALVNNPVPCRETLARAIDFIAEFIPVSPLMFTKSKNESIYIAKDWMNEDYQRFSSLIEKRLKEIEEELPPGSSEVAIARQRILRDEGWEIKVFALNRDDQEIELAPVLKAEMEKVAKELDQMILLRADYGLPEGVSTDRTKRKINPDSGETEYFENRIDSLSELVVIACYIFLCSERDKAPLVRNLKKCAYCSKYSIQQNAISSQGKTFCNKNCNRNFHK